MRQEQGWKRRFFTVWIGQAFSLFGSSLASFALIWWITQKTGSATVLAMATLISMLPGIFMGPFMGSLVDRWDRRRIMIVADLVGALAAAALAVLFWSGRIEVWHIYTAMFVRSLAGGFHFPAMQASTSLMVPDGQLTRVAGFNQALQGASAIVAPALGALLITLLPFEGIMAIDIVTALIAVVAVISVSIPSPIRDDQGNLSISTVLQDTAAGLRYIWNWRGLRNIMIVATLLNLVINPAFSLLPILVTRYFGQGAGSLAAMEAAVGFGTILGSLILGIWGGFKRRIMTTIFGLSGLALGTLLLGLAPASMFTLAIGGMLIVGITQPITNGPVFAIVQSLVPPELQGRVFTVIGSMSMAISPLGLLVAGPIADRFGVQVWYLAGGLATALLMVICLWMPSIRNVEDEHAEQHVGGLQVVER